MKKQLHSIILELIPAVRLYQIEGTISDGAMILGDRISARGGYNAPWSACADLLVSQDDQFVGFTYCVDQMAEFAKDLAASAGSDLVRYVESASTYGREIYKGSKEDWFEIRFSKKEVGSVVHALSVDGVWYLDPLRPELMAFGIAELESLLHDYDLRFDELNHIPFGVPKISRVL